MEGSVEWSGQFSTASGFRGSLRAPLTATSFTLVFLVALFASLCVRAHRDATPAAFAARVDLASHRKAADYTVAKQRFGMLETAADAMVLIVVTLGGGLAWLVAATGSLPVGPVS